MSIKHGLAFFLVVMTACQAEKGSLASYTVDPIFQVDVAAPTADKPQSKIWFDKNTWWALLPHQSGPSLWKRTSEGWIENEWFRDTLDRQPGKADVFHDHESTLAVLVGDCTLKILKLTFSDSQLSYEPALIATLPIPENCTETETATLTKDGNGIWWVASDLDNKIMVWSSSDGVNWTQPQPVAENINKDDICTIANIPNGISVIWSNQDDDLIGEVVHKDDVAVGQWSEPIIVARGNKTADDHLNTTLLEDGTLVVVSKNSLDQVNFPQFVLRIRDAAGHWENIPYANLTQTEVPTRPVVTHTHTGKIIEAHTVRYTGSPQYYYISLSEIFINDDQWSVEEKLQVKSAINGNVNNATFSKAAFPKDAEAWLILFSDNEGNVYEFDVKKYADRSSD